jgi:carbon starvation protein
MATMPVALFMGFYVRYIRPGRIGEVSVIGFVLLMAAIVGGQAVFESPVWGRCSPSPATLTWMLIGYGFVASVLPVWLLLAPRDYLSTFLKIGTIVALAIGIVVVARWPCRRSPSSPTATARSGPVTCSPSCSSPSPAARCRASMR